MSASRERGFTADLSGQRAAALVLAKTLQPCRCGRLVALNAILGGRSLEPVTISDLPKLAHGFPGSNTEYFSADILLATEMQR